MVSRFLGRTAWPTFVFVTWLAYGLIIALAATHNL